MAAGYSSTPLARKLGIKPAFRITLINEPSHYFNLFQDLPEDLIRDHDGTAVDFIHLFLTEKKDLESNVREAMNQLTKNGSLWISWPKRTSKIKTDLNRDLIREAILEIGLVDVKIAAIDDDWSGLKFVYRKKDR